MITFSSEIKNKVFENLISLSDIDIKNSETSTISEIISLTESLFRVTDRQNIASEEFETFNLSMALKYFTSPYLKIRLNGLNDIKNFLHKITMTPFQVVPAESNSDSHWATSRYSSSSSSSLLLLLLLLLSLA